MSLFRRGITKLRREGPVATLQSAKSRLAPVIVNEVRSSLRSGNVMKGDGVFFDTATDGFPPEYESHLRAGKFGPNNEWVASITNHIARQQSDVVEIGAGLGYMSTQVNRKIGPHCQHVVVEANEYLLPALRRTKELNNCHFKIVNGAYATGVDEITLNIHDDYIDSTVDDGLGESEETLSVPAVTLRELTESHNIEEFVLYTNMEGAEYDLIENELDLVRERCPLVVISYHDFTDDDTDAAISLLADEFDEIWSTGTYPGTRIYSNPRLC